MKSVVGVVVAVVFAGVFESFCFRELEEDEDER